MAERRMSGMRWLGLAPWAALVGSLALMWLDPGGMMSSVRSLVFDFYQRTAPREYVDPATLGFPGVRYIDIDDESLARYGQWPWPRTLMAELVNKTREAGARVMVFDIVFAEEDRTSPELIAERLPDDPSMDSVRAALRALPSNDEAFAEAIASMKTVTGFVLGSATETREPRLRSGQVFNGDFHPTMSIKLFNGVVATREILEEAAVGNGALNVIPEDDAIVRRVPLIFGLNGKFYPSIALEAVRLIGKRTNLAVRTSGSAYAQAFGANAGINAIKAGDTIIEPAPDGQISLHFTYSVPGRRVSAWQVLSGEMTGEPLNGAIVFVGTSAAGLKDIRSTPLETAIPGVEVQVQAVEQMMMGGFLARPDYADAAELLYAGVIGAIIAILVAYVHANWIGALALLGAGAAALISWIAFTQYQLLVDPIGPSMTTLSVFFVSALVNYMRTESERSFVRGAFSRYLDEDVVNQLAANPDRLMLGGETRNMSMLFCDVRGFTTISEAFAGDPQGLTRLINRILTPLSRVVLDTKGTIDKYMGDCIMSFWNAPLDDPEHGLNACRCAMAMIEEVDLLNGIIAREAAERGHVAHKVAVGVGINSGDCVVGNMGSDMRFDYTVLGDSVNLAARIQTYSSHWGVAIAVSQDTARLADAEFAFVHVDDIVVKGKDKPVAVFAMMGRKAMAETDAFRNLAANQALIWERLRARDWAGARAAIAEGRKLGQIKDDLYELYEERLDHWERNPPPAEWDGAWRATSK